jgi:hypothetical protein
MTLIYRDIKDKEIVYSAIKANHLEISNLNSISAENIQQENSLFCQLQLFNIHDYKAEYGSPIGSASSGIIKEVPAPR